MSEAVIETFGLRKEFRTRRGRHIVAVHDLDLTVPAGGVHGFLGPNGSGKTTTIRMLLGLARASRGEMRLFGRPVPEHLPEVMDRVGAVVEQPKFIPTFTGRKNLSLLARSIGVPASRVDAALEQVGMTGRDKERFKGYSLGMKQRLAIAATLLKSPDLLILDEPTNGLDPAGIRDIRDMIRDLGESGVTVLLSSHILAEVQQVCHSVSIIGNGRLLAHGDVAELVQAGASAVRVGVAETGTAATALSAAGLSVTRDGAGLLVEGAGDPATITRLLAEQGMYVHELNPVRADLESVFLQLTKGEALGGSGHGATAPGTGTDTTEGAA
ncbi:ABC transporter ATP-binding protein [Nocardioides pakistanensis]